MPKSRTPVPPGGYDPGMLRDICRRCGQLAFRCTCAGLGLTIGLGTILPSKLGDLPVQAASAPVVVAAANASTNSVVDLVYDTITDREYVLPRPDWHVT